CVNFARLVPTPMTYRALSAQALAEQDYDAFLTELQKSLTDGRRDPNEVVRDTLFESYYGASQPDRENLSLPARAAYHALDPRNVATEPEYYTDIDQKLYAERKPMIWLWQMFDRSPLGQNSLLGHRFRSMLAPMIFRSVGDNFKCWHFVEWSFGYNLYIGDNVSISDYANVYSHHHDIYDIHKVETPRTRIGNGVRLTYHSTVLAGMEISDNALVGTGAVVTRNVEPYHIVVGIPAKTVKIKEKRAQ